MWYWQWPWRTSGAGVVPGFVRDGAPSKQRVSAQHCPVSLRSWSVGWESIFLGQPGGLVNPAVVRYPFCADFGCQLPTCPGAKPLLHPWGRLPPPKAAWWGGRWRWWGLQPTRECGIRDPNMPRCCCCCWVTKGAAGTVQEWPGATHRELGLPAGHTNSPKLANKIRRKRKYLSIW